MSESVASGETAAAAAVPDKRAPRQGDAQAPAMIVLEAVSRIYEGGYAVEKLSLTIAEGEFAVLVGPSGCGKTTTLRMINRLVEPSEGRILINGRDASEVSPERLRRGIGYVIQQTGLFPHQTVAENVATVPKLLGWDKRRIEARVDELLELVGLPGADFGRRMPSELSGGQRQRVGVARALGADPPILLMDEPFGAVDPVVRGRLQDELIRLQRVVRKTVVFVTHDIDEAVKLGDKIALLKVGGRLAQYDAPANILGHPADAFVEEFLGGTRLLRRLALIPISSIELRQDRGRPSISVDGSASLRDGLDACMRAPDGQVAVVDGDRFVGVIDVELIRRAAAAP